MEAMTTGLIKRIFGTGALLLCAALLLTVAAPSDAGKGKRLVGKDVGKGRSPVAVATATVKNPKKLKFVITTKPRKLPVEWTYTTDCSKNGEIKRYPPPGEHVTREGRSKVKGNIKMAAKRPDSCRIAVSGKLAYKSGKKVIAKIFHRG